MPQGNDFHADAQMIGFEQRTIGIGLGATHHDAIQIEAQIGEMQVEIAHAYLCSARFLNAALYFAQNRMPERLVMFEHENAGQNHDDNQHKNAGNAPEKNLFPVPLLPGAFRAQVFRVRKIRIFVVHRFIVFTGLFVFTGTPLQNA